MKNLADGDASWASSQCTASNSHSLIIIDWGEVGYNSGRYGTYNFAYGAPFISSSDIVNDMHTYLSELFAQTSSCPRITVALGVSNYNECPNSECSVYDAGLNWSEYVVTALSSWLSSQNYAWQINVWGADDMEVGWDQPTPTESFVNGFYYSDNTGCKCLIADFGDAWTPQNGWTNADVYYVAWQEGFDVPMPEIYNTNNSSVNAWIAVANSEKNGSAGTMQMYGEVTECQTGDPLPSSYCTVDGTQEYAPQGAYNALVTALQQNSLPISSYGDSVNIQFQPL